MKLIQVNENGYVIYEMHVYDSLTDDEKASIGSGILVEDIPNPPSTDKQYRKKYSAETGFSFEEILPDRITELETIITRKKLLDMDCTTEQEELKILLGY